MQRPEFYCIRSNKSPSPIRSSASDGLLWLCDKYFLVVLGNRKTVKNRYSDFVMSLAWLVWVVDENLITLGGWWMCGWPVAMHRAWLHWSLHCWIDGLPGSRCERSVLTNRAKRKELLNINPLICFQGAGSWRGQWTERLHVNLRHRLPPGGSRLLVFFLPFSVFLSLCLSLSLFHSCSLSLSPSAELTSRRCRQRGHSLTADRIVRNRESDLERVDSMWSRLLFGGPALIWTTKKLLICSKRVKSLWPILSHDLSQDIISSWVIVGFFVLGLLKSLLWTYGNSFFPQTTSK